MMIEITSKQEFDEIIANNDAVLAYYSHDRCSVCKTLKPKIASTYGENFPKMKQVYINIEKLPEIAGQERVFTVPVIVVYFVGKENIRKARNVGVQELASEIDRYYQMVF